MVKRGMGKRNGSLSSVLNGLLVVLLAIGMVLPATFAAQPVYAEASSLDAGSGASAEAVVPAGDNVIDLSIEPLQESGEGWTYNEGFYTIRDGAEVIVTGASSNQRRIEVEKNVTAKITR